MDSRLYLQTATRNGCTRVEDVFCTAPYKIMRPFIRGDRADIMVMAASAGLLAGDTLEAEYRFESGSNAAVYTQGYEKVFNTGEGHVSRHIRLQVDQGAYVRFLPQPIIPFAGSDLRSQTQVSLAQDCRFAYAEIVACGRAGRGEKFQMRRLDSRLQVTIDGRLAFADHTRPACVYRSYRSGAMAEHDPSGAAVCLWASMGGACAESSASGRRIAGRPCRREPDCAGCVHPCAGNKWRRTLPTILHDSGTNGGISKVRGYVVTLS